MEELVFEIARHPFCELAQFLHEGAEFSFQVFSVLWQAIRIDVGFHIIVRILVGIAFRQHLG